MFDNLSIWKWHMVRTKLKKQLLIVIQYRIKNNLIMTIDNYVYGIFCREIFFF